jgi:hypothetical protein
MKDDILTNLQKTSLLTALAFLFLPLVAAAGEDSNRISASTVIEQMRQYLDKNANVQAVDFSKIKSGKILVESLPAEDKRETAFFGIMSVNAPAELSFNIFQENISRLGRKSLLAANSFSNPPSLADLEDLTLEEGDIEVLKKCRVGKCGLRLSVQMIERFQSEVDWQAADYQQQATNLFRRMILQYMQDYLLRGDAALIEYNDHPKPVSLRQEQEGLLKDLSWINNHAPEFFDYLRNPQHAEPANIKKSISWAKVKFGLRPVIIITQTITYTAENDDGSSKIISVSKQLYASRYFDSSLGLMLLIQAPEDNNTIASKLFYISRSRAPALEGIFGKFVRKIVEPEVVEKLYLLLRNTKSRAESTFKPEDAPAVTPTGESRGSWIDGQYYLVGILILIGAFLAIHWLSKKESFNKTGSAKDSGSN